MAKSKIADSDVLTYLQERKQYLKEELSKIETALSSFVGIGDKPADKKGKKKDKKKKLEKAVKAIRKKVSKAIEGVKNQAEALVENFSAANAGPAESSPKKDATKTVAPKPAKQTVAAKAETPDTKPATKAVRKRTSKAEAAAESVKAISSTPKAEKAAARAATAPAETAEAKAPVKKTRASKTEGSKPETAKAVEASAPAPKKAAAKTPASFDPKATMDEKIRYALGQKKDSTKEELIDYLNGLEPDYGLTKLRKVVAFRLNHLLKTGQIKSKNGAAGLRYAN